MFIEIKKYISAFLSLLFCFITLFPAIICENAQQNEIDKQLQIERIAKLEQLYKSESYVPVDENQFCDFDYYKEQGNIKLNELSFIATHNSYQLDCVNTYKELFDDMNTVSFGLINSELTNYKSDTLTEQFNLGIRSIELDIETVVKDGKTSFVCVHSPVIDSTTNCYDFGLALKEIKLWSDANPGHLPITVIIEAKKVFIPNNGMKLISLEYINTLETLLRETFEQKLLTPADVMGEYSSLKEMREADAWPTLSSCAGKVMFLFHDAGVLTDRYISKDKSLKTRAMFPMLRYNERDKSYASFLLVNKPKDALKNKDEIKAKRLAIRTRVDSYGSFTEEKTQTALASGAMILSTDYPKKADMIGVERVVSFENGKTVRLVK